MTAETTPALPAEVTRVERPSRTPSRKTRDDIITHAILIVGVLIFALPVWIILMGSTHEAATIGRGEVPLLPGGQGVENFSSAWTEGAARTTRVPVETMLFNSFLMAMAVAIGKIVLSLLSAYAIVFFRFPFKGFFFWTIFLTLMLPVEVRIFPTFEVMSDLGLLNTYGGLVMPLIASATATLLFRQFFLTIPDEFVEAAKVDGAGPMRFFWDILVPLSVTNIAALFVIQFVYGWNQYLWPLLVITSNAFETIVVGMVRMIGSEANTDWNIVMATAVLAMLPPVAVVILMQKWFVKGLTDTEK
jgi:sn-glycerol 3-phosphate transport system permease protein